ncbi:O-acyltransferase (WSD1-like) family protein [Raphanus sativus]|uniref:Wax ester synthase/diacylglycerol acyltransferase 7 n=1 Tax=Raphanus sativus TaxID=3726 RepID=A0A6J0L1S9_RAPSA|nr:wax ester synthase/diacylglycerol acyltransferase 7 [Raphanus sativus]KAJ4875689.1 O-acyltransferase (WSD1-like) family protein [Raphanus sativus]
MNEEEEPLSPMARIFQSSGTDYCTVITIGFKTKINPDVILDDLKQNVSKHPRLSSKLADDGARWIKTEVNVEDHVFVPDIDTGEIGDKGDRFVEDYISRLTTLPLDRSRPLWDIHILNVKTSDAEAVGIIRSHHSLGDGMSRMSLIMACTHKTSDPEALPTIPILRRRENVSDGIRDTGWFLSSMVAIYATTRLIWNTIIDLLLLLATVLFLKDTETSLKGGAEADRNYRRFSHRIVSLDDIRIIKDAMDMTINDVLLGVTQAALSRYINGAHDKTSEHGGTSTPLLNNIPCNIRVRAGVLVNLRSKFGIQPLADMMEKDSKCRWGNHINIVVLPLSIGLETDPLVYLSKAKSTMDQKKNSLHAPVLYSILSFIISVFGAKIGAALFKRVLLSTTACISNVNGPTEEISFHGHPIAYIIPSVYGHPQALMIHLQSYADKMAISIAVDPTIIPDPHKLCDEMEESLKSMKIALVEKGLLNDEQVSVRVNNMCN